METKTMVKVEKAEDKKTDTKAVPAAAETKPAPKASQEKAAKETKTAAKETKTAAKKTTKAAAKTIKTAAKTTKAADKETKAAVTKSAKPAAKTAKASTDKKINTFLQFAGNEYNMDDVVEKVRAAAASDTGKKTFKSLDIYIKPEENVAYYVVNGKPGSVQL